MSTKRKFLDEIPPLAEYQAQQADKDQRELYLKGSRERTSARRVTAPLSEGDREYYRVMSEMAASKMEDYVAQYANDNNMSLVSAAIKLSKTKDEDNIEDPIVQNYVNTRKQFINLSTQYRTGKIYLDDCIATYTSNNPNPGHYSERTKEVADNPSKFGFEQVTRDKIRPGGLVLFTNKGVPYHAAALDTIINGRMKLNYSPGADRDYVRGGNEWDSPESKLYYNFVGNSEDSLRWEKEYNEKYGIKKRLGGSTRRLANLGTKTEIPPTTTNNRLKDEKEIDWIYNWLKDRKDILKRNAEATSWHYNKYYPKNNTGDVRKAGFTVESYMNGYNPFTYFNNSNPVDNRVNKIIYSQVENVKNVPKTEVGEGHSDRYDLKGVYVEPDYFGGTGHYVAFAGQDIDPAVKIHEFTHASHPIQQEAYISDVIFKDRDIPNITGKKLHKSYNAKELYGALQEFRYKNNINPKQVITKEWIEKNKDLFKYNYLDKVSDDDKLRLLNEVARVEIKENNKHRVKLGGSCRRSLKDGGIYIKPSHRGRFTALKERTGHSSTWFKENGTPAQKKMATFALNAAKWKH